MIGIAPAGGKIPPAWRPVILDRIVNRIMPPWHAYVDEGAEIVLFESGERVLRVIDHLHDAPADAVADAPGDSPDAVAPLPPASTDAGDAPAR